MVETVSTNCGFVSHDNPRTITGVRSFISSRIQFFSLQVEGLAVEQVIDAAPLKYIYGIEANEVELLIGEFVSVSLRERNKYELPNIGDFIFEKDFVENIKNKHRGNLIKFEKISYAFPYHVRNNTPTRVCLITSKASAVFLTVKDFEQTTGLRVHEVLMALGCYVWTPYFEILEGDVQQQKDIYEQTVLQPDEVIFRYCDSYDKLRINPFGRADIEIWGNKKRWANYYKELQFEKQKLYDDGKKDDLSEQGIQDAFDGFPDAIWNID